MLRRLLNGLAANQQALNAIAWPRRASIAGGLRCWAQRRFEVGEIKINVNSDLALPFLDRGAYSKHAAAVWPSTQCSVQLGPRYPRRSAPLPKKLPEVSEKGDTQAVQALPGL